MSKSKFTLILAVWLMFFFQSCTEKVILDTETRENLQVYEQENLFSFYYIDDKQVLKADYENYIDSKNEKFIIIASKKNKDSYFAYTDENGYIQYGERNNINLKEQLAFEQKMQKYAEETGAIDEYEKTGIIPQKYIDFEKEYYEQLSGKNKAYFYALNKEHDMQGSNLMMGETFAAMPPSWNNEVSCIQSVGLLGMVTIFDKWFYRDRIATIQFLDLQKRNLYGGADNTTSSIIKAW